MELSVKAIHPMQRESAGPAGGKCVADNPPALLWPAEAGVGVRYAVRLSQDPAFPEDRTIRAEGFRWALLGTDTRPGPVIGVSSLVALALLISGTLYFRRMEKTFADVV